MTFSIGHS